MKNKINLLTCKFEDKELEKKYQEVKWTNVSSFYNNVLKFFLFIGITYLLFEYMNQPKTCSCSSSSYDLNEYNSSSYLYILLIDITYSR